MSVPRSSWSTPHRGDRWLDPCLAAATDRGKQNQLFPMAHPMHLHGHVFQVVALNGQAMNGALRDTVHVPPMSMVSVALDAGEAARWMLHCHHMPHLATGMMTEFTVSA